MVTLLLPHQPHCNWLLFPVCQYYGPGLPLIPTHRLHCWTPDDIDVCPHYWLRDVEPLICASGRCSYWRWTLFPVAPRRYPTVQLTDPTAFGQTPRAYEWRCRTHWWWLVEQIYYQPWLRHCPTRWCPIGLTLLPRGLLLQLPDRTVPIVNYRIPSCGIVPVRTDISQVIRLIVGRYPGIDDPIVIWLFYPHCDRCWTTLWLSRWRTQTDISARRGILFII